MKVLHMDSVEENQLGSAPIRQNQWCSPSLKGKARRTHTHTHRRAHTDAQSCTHSHTHIHTPEPTHTHTHRPRCCLVCDVFNPKDEDLCRHAYAKVIGNDPVAWPPC